jgi:SAM-dependent methyltransferase
MSRAELFHQLASDLNGNGIEFGAGGLPFPVLPHVSIRYADRNTVEQLRDRNYFGDRELVTPALLSDLETMEGIEDDSLDFIIASHVIEHTCNPLLALQNGYRKLRQGGKFLLIVPDKPATFDRDRELTSLEHLILDYQHPSRERDWEHYVEFMTKSFPQPDPVAAAKGPFDLKTDIHFHTWTFESFAETIEYARRELSPWREVWSLPRLSADDIEFYFVLTK